MTEREENEPASPEERWLETYGVWPCRVPWGAELLRVVIAIALVVSGHWLWALVAWCLL